MKISIVSEIPSTAAPSTARSAESLPVFCHPVWAERWPWLRQGITTRGKDENSCDLGLFGGSRANIALRNWDRLRTTAGLPAAAHSRQPHGSVARVHGPAAPGLHLADSADAHLTRAPGLLVGVTVADCVPVTLVCEDPRVVGVVHAGWRGVVDGVLERTMATASDRFGITARDLHLHFGPAICGDCYEVGPEVHQALGLNTPEAPAPLDLREELVRRALSAGVPRNHLSRSGHCTLCGSADGERHFFSHRAGDPERQVAWVGLGDAGERP